MKNKKLLVSFICAFVLMCTGVCYADVGGSSPDVSNDTSSDGRRTMVTAFMDIWGEGEADSKEVVYLGRSTDKAHAGQLLYSCDEYEFYFEAKTDKLLSVINLSENRRTLSEGQALAAMDATLALVYGDEYEGSFERSIKAYQSTTVSYGICKDDISFSAAVFNFDPDDAFTSLVLYHPNIDDYTFGDFISEDDSLAYAKAAVRAYVADKNQDMDVDEKLGEPVTEGRKTGIAWAKRVAWTWKIDYEDNGILGYNLGFQVAVDALDGHILSLASNIGGYSEKPENHDDIKYFLTRLYENFLGREPEEKGLNDWLDALLTGKATGSKVVYGFVYSPEFKANPLNNEEYVTAMYRTVLGREPDTEGLSAWVAVLDQGCTRKKILEGFLNSQEMKNLCSGMGIDPGSYQSDDILDRNAKLTFFVNRLYQYGLRRQADESGLRGWVNSLARHEIDGVRIAWAFFAGDEFLDIVSNLDVFTALQGMYKALADTELSRMEFNSWIFPAYMIPYNNKYGGVSTFIGIPLENLVASQEYKELCESHGVEYDARGIVQQ